ncbi:restriction endonuclease subunit S [Methanobrevibacter sp. DSM 116169]|uniref:restriction endonuclease subunit S n=1 Tax=Methanobrevibacter sp. DSM 116169 TaxID=3242727 RepID=UPI0038FC7752
MSENNVSERKKENTNSYRREPQLRFKEFNKLWVLKRLNDISYIYDGTHQTPHYMKNGVKFLSVENINNFSDTKKYISNEVYENEYKIKPIVNDIFMTRIGNIGTSNILLNDEKFAFYVSLALIRVNNNINAEFINQYIKFENFQKELHKKTLHVAFPKKINLNEIGKCLINIPSFEEQGKIAKFLTFVDEKIELLEKTLKLLKTYKKGIMQQIFSQKIRFKDKNDENYLEWEEKQLGELFDERNEKGNENLELLSVTLNHGVIKRNEIESKNNKHKNEYKRVLPGDIPYNSMRMWQGASGMSEHDGVVSPAYTVLIPSKGISPRFFAYYFKQDFIIYQFKKYSQGLTSDTWNLKYPLISQIKINFPPLKEQEKIACLLLRIDEKIEMIAKKIEVNKEFKQGLIQKMFC